MVELISKWEVVDRLTALENELQQYKPFTEREQKIYRRIVEVEMTIGKTPAVEAEPVVHAHWNGDCCSACDELAEENYPRCPHCGAHMDEEVAE